MSENNGFIVAFRYTKEAGPYEGVITAVSFPSEEHFNEWYTPDIAKRQEVVEKGISQDRVSELGDQTPVSALIKVAISESTDENGRIIPELLEMNLGNIISLMRDIDKRNKIRVELRRLMLHGFHDFHG